jgi:hypothetical protein
MTDIDLSDELARLSKFCACLVAAISGAETFHNGAERDGVLWLAGDIASDIAALTDAFEDERELRATEKELA